MFIQLSFKFNIVNIYKSRLIDIYISHVRSRYLYFVNFEI